MIQLHTTDLTTYPNTASPGAGGTLVDGWIDVSGVVSISSGKAKWTGSGMLLRPASENVLQALASATFATATQGDGPGCVVRGNSSTNSGYVAFLYGGTVYIRSIVSGGATALTYSTTGGFGGYASGQAYGCSLEARSTDSTHTTLIFKVWNLASPATIGTYTVTGDTTASLQSAGQLGIYQFGANDGLLHATTDDTFDLGDGSVSVNGNNITLSVSPTGGSGSYTYSWYRYSTPTGGLTSGLATTQTYVDTQTDGIVRYYNCSVSDGLVTKIMLRQGYGSTDIAAGAPDPVVPSFATMGVLGIVSGNLAVVDVGDSISSGILAGHEQTDLALSASGSPTITVTTCGHAGATTADWLPTAAATGTGQSVYDATKNNFNGAVEACTATGAKLVSIQLGTNDWVFGSATYTAAAANVATIAAAFNAAGVSVVLHHIPYKFSQSYNYVWPLAFHPLLDALVDGKKIFAGAPDYFLYGANHWPTVYSGDWTHPADVPGGVDALAAFKVNRVLACLIAISRTAGKPVTGSHASFAGSGIIVQSYASFVE